MSQSQAITYQKNSQRQQQDGLELLSKLSLQKGMTILDMGCGTEYLSSVLADHVGPSGSVLAVDPDLERLKVAKETYGDIPNLKFVEGSTDDFPSEEQQFDIVFSNYVLHWVSDKEGALKRIYKSLKPGGKFGFVAIVKHGIDFEMFVDLMDHDAERKRSIYEMIHYMPMEYYEATAINCGFSTLSKDIHIACFDFQNIDEALNLCFAATQGAFDPKLADAKELQQFKQRFGNEPVKIDAVHNAVMTTILSIIILTVAVSLL